MEITNIYLKITLNVVVIFLCAFLLSFIPELWPHAFGDWHCDGRIIIGWEKIHEFNYPKFGGCDYNSNTNGHSPEWHWGVRHWIWFFMCMSCFIIQTIRIIIMIKQNIKDHGNSSR